MQKLIAFLLSLLTFQSYAQQANFTKKIFTCEFTDADKTYWPLRNNSGFNFTIENGRYTIECLDEKKIAYAPLKWDQRPEEYKVEINLGFENGMEGIVGFAYGVADNLEYGYIIQFDKRLRYRICQIDAGNLRILTGDRKNGWEEFKKLNRPGKNNKLDITQSSGKISISINDASVITYHNRLKSLSGGFGFRLDGRAGAQVNNFTIYGSGAPAVDSILYKATQAQKSMVKDSNRVKKASAAIKKDDTSGRNTVVKPPLPLIKDTSASPIVPPGKKASAKSSSNARKHAAKASSEEKKQSKTAKQNNSATAPKDSLVTSPKAEALSPPAKTKESKVSENKAQADSSRNVTTLGIAYGETRKENLKLKSERDNYAAELKQIKMKNEELQAFINKNLDIKLKNELDVQKNKNEALSTENAKLKEENTDLQKFKEQIAKARDGDIIVLLSENLKAEQKKNEELTKKIKDLEERARVKSNPSKPPVGPSSNQKTGNAPAKPVAAPPKPVQKP